MPLTLDTLTASMLM